jgi:hypothetical protein
MEQGDVDPMALIVFHLSGSEACGFVGGIVKNLDGKFIGGVVKVADRLDQPLDDILFIVYR